MTTTAEKATTSAETKIGGAQPEKADKPLDKRRALGRGLDSLLPTSPLRDNRAGWPSPAPTGTRIVSGERARTPGEASAAPQPGPGMREISAEAEPALGEAVRLVGLDQIDPNPYQTRMEFDAQLLQDLAESIRGNGVVQPIVVRPGTAGRYVLVLGERRCRASKLAGQATIPALVRRVSDQQAAEITVVENLQRQDLNCLEQAGNGVQQAEQTVRPDAAADRRTSGIVARVGIELHAPAEVAARGDRISDDRGDRFHRSARTAETRRRPDDRAGRPARCRKTSFPPSIDGSNRRHHDETESAAASRTGLWRSLGGSQCAVGAE
jgi:ParB/RepB/Spo0J family partition protein